MRPCRLLLDPLGVFVAVDGAADFGPPSPRFLSDSKRRRGTNGAAQRSCHSFTASIVTSLAKSNLRFVFVFFSHTAVSKEGTKVLPFGLSSNAAALCL